jgi:hypothetical protein
MRNREKLADDRRITHDRQLAIYLYLSGNIAVTSPGNLNNMI